MAAPDRVSVARGTTRTWSTSERDARTRAAVSDDLPRCVSLIHDLCAPPCTHAAALPFGPLPHPGGRLCSRAKVSPGIVPSRQDQGNQRHRPGNRYLARVQGETAVVIARSGTLLGEWCRRIASCRGKTRAIGAISRSILVIALIGETATSPPIGLPSAVAELVVLNSSRFRAAADVVTPGLPSETRMRIGTLHGHPAAGAKYSMHPCHSAARSESTVWIDRPPFVKRYAIHDRPGHH